MHLKMLSPIFVPNCMRIGRCVKFAGNLIFHFAISIYFFLVNTGFVKYAWTEPMNISTTISYSLNFISVKYTMGYLDMGMYRNIARGQLRTPVFAVRKVDGHPQK